MSTLVKHKRARLDLEIGETLEAGIVLLGTEVKSLRAGNAVLLGAHIIVRGGEVFLVGMQIPAYQVANAGPNYEPDRTRKLLLNSTQIHLLSGYASKKGYTIVPLSLYEKGKKIKVEIGIGRGKKKFDKRADLKRRDDERHMARSMSE